MELPLYELAVVRVQGAGEPPPVSKEAESLPVLVDVHVVEELDDGHRLLELGDLVLRASVPEEVIYGLLVPAGDLGGEADASVAGGMGAHGEEDVVARHALVSADGVDVRVAAQMSDVEIPRDAGVGEYDHELGLAVNPLGLVEARLLPACLLKHRHRLEVPQAAQVPPLSTTVPRESATANQFPSLPECHAKTSSWQERAPAAGFPSIPRR